MGQGIRVVVFFLLPDFALQRLPVYSIERINDEKVSVRLLSKSLSCTDGYLFSVKTCECKKNG